MLQYSVIFFLFSCFWSSPLTKGMHSPLHFYFTFYEIYIYCVYLKKKKKKETSILDLSGCFGKWN